MPTIKLSQQTKEKLETMMANELRSQVDKSTGKAKRELFIQLIQKKFGLTFDAFINRLIEKYTE